jgi:hypothetical protein
MPRKKIYRKSITASLDVFEAIKRAFIRDGFIRQKNIHRRPKLQNNKHELVNVTESAHDILFKANTIFPFTLFPDTVELDREKLTFTSRIFFGVAKINSIPVRDILSVEVDIGPFFGSVHTSSRFFVTTPFSVGYLWRSDALQLQRLLQGYVIAEEQKIDCSDIPKAKLIKILLDLGTASDNK